MANRQAALQCAALFFAVAATASLSACTTGRLEYLTPEGERKYACATEYTWQPSVDKYAVEYVLAHCAKQAQAQGNTVVDTRLLTLDLSLPRPPEGRQWTHELAKQQHQSGQLTDQQYGYIIAYLDLGLDSD
ncbi:hypothetical protein [Pseudidiomarina mangrovi]|uniref:hypothetical protein n=1 Tax=Pseudidiomarina mangrovi TaxID=2487133 RepID=UPI000FCCB880|nr:hypothetical protein [Pseudidiomarina mangrovi]